MGEGVPPRTVLDTNRAVAGAASVKQRHLAAGGLALQRCIHSPPLCVSRAPEDDTSMESFHGLSIGFTSVSEACH
ncbi:hypothetical protein JZ751_005630 [Albula glossodonta]|uniref:Uncharacterized protein n=1 Tax=Albula glossodonta TaxID=121402 RepID=A0A8T2NFD0_9TELE|nr:hypothetical protein JZ751_005630 [Albula glossodonta]